MLRIAIVGSAVAGFAAARALRRQSFDGEIVVVGAERHQPYDRPPLSKDFLTGACSAADLAHAARRVRRSSPGSLDPAPISGSYWSQVARAPESPRCWAAS